MNNVLELLLSTDLWFTVIKLATPVIFAALGAYYASRVGLFNIGLEGIMLIGAFGGVMLSGYLYSTGMADAISLIFTLLFVIILGAIGGFFIGYFHLKLDADVGITGLVYNLFASGVTVFLLFVIVGDKGASYTYKSLAFPYIDLPIIKNIPIIGDIISGHNLLTYLAFLLVILTAYIMKNTTVGLRFRATGENSDAVESVGISSVKYKLIGFTISGILGSIGGAFLSMGYVPYFIPAMTAGRGFIGLTANLVGITPVGGMLISILFGFADAIGFSLQIFSSIPSQFISMLPFVFTLLTMIGYSYYRKRKSEY